MSEKFKRVQTALANARSERDYEGAKLTAARLPADEQFAIVDSFIDCRRRLADMGVLR